MAQRFEVAVVGRGLIGAAAARHLAETGASTVLLGAAEPLRYESSEGPFASHYDEGRVTRITAGSPIWSELAVRSIDRYSDIAERSGIGFHTACGLAYVSPTAASDMADGARRGADVRLVSREWLHETTGIQVATQDSESIVFEGPPAGLINPRRLIAAQTELAETAGARLMDGAVESISGRMGGFVIAGAAGTVESEQVLLATGAYGARLVGIDLAIERRLRTIVMAELGPGPNIPSLILNNVDNPALDRIYWVPPVPFPDGRTMLKIGGESLPLIRAHNDADITRWFHSGGSLSEASALREVVEQLLPDAAVKSWDHKPCVVANTPSQLPYVGWIEEGVAVALGGSGSAAKSSDELGRLAATLFHPGGWNDGELNADDFAPQLQ